MPPTREQKQSKKRELLEKARQLSKQSSTSSDGHSQTSQQYAFDHGKHRKMLEQQSRRALGSQQVLNQSSLTEPPVEDQRFQDPVELHGVDFYRKRTTTEGSAEGSQDPVA